MVDLFLVNTTMNDGGRAGEWGLSERDMKGLKGNSSSSSSSFPNYSLGVTVLVKFWSV